MPYITLPAPPLPLTSGPPGSLWQTDQLHHPGLDRKVQNTFGGTTQHHRGVPEPPNPPPPPSLLPIEPRHLLVAVVGLGPGDDADWQLRETPFRMEPRVKKPPGQNPRDVRLSFFLLEQH